MNTEFENLFIQVDSNPQAVLDFIKDSAPDALLQTHRDGRTLLHKAIESLNTDIIEALINKNRGLLFINDAHGLSPLALTLQKYHDCRSIVSKTVANQIYFKLTRGEERNRTVNQRVNILGQFSLMHDRLWQHGLELCFRKDSQDQIVGVDKDWIDFVVQVVDDGLYVDYGLLGGADVDREIMLWWVEHEYSQKAFQMFWSAVQGQHSGLTARTITQMTHNAHLTKSKEMMTRAGLNLPFLVTAKTDPKAQRISADIDIILYFEGKLYYQDKTSVTEINPEDLLLDKHESYRRLIEIFSAEPINKSATFEEAMDVFNVKPMPTPVEPAAAAVTSTSPGVTPVKRSIRGLHARQGMFTASTTIPPTPATPFNAIGDNGL